MSGSQATAASHEPALAFWLRYAEREGALVDDGGDQALAVLPPALQRSAHLPEEVALTPDPDVAREDGAVLLIPGHPALEGAATAVLAEGDVGRAFLAWPTGPAPRLSELQGRARECLHVEHGRIDAVADPRRVYAPLLAVGAAISYAASLTHRLQEQEHVWVDARTGLPVSDEAFAALDGRPRLAAPDTAHAPLDFDLGRVLQVAHQRLEERAAARRAALSAQARRALEAELARADSYYQGVLETIERRRARAPAERQRLLDGQAEATRAEHARRRREIADEFRTRHEIRPFRLHLLFMPALVLPVEIRRGARRFPLELVWLCPARGFAGVRCPHCSAAAALVAGRDRLGCRECTGPPATRATAAPRHAAAPPRGTGSRERSKARTGAPEASDGGPEASGEPQSRQPSRRPVPGTDHGAGHGRAPGGRDRRQAGGAGVRSAGPGSTGEAGGPAHGRRSGSGRALMRTGDRLALAFWQAVADGARWPRKKMARDSPLRALYRLYGSDGPLRAIGLPPGRWPQQVTTTVTLPFDADGPLVTGGAVFAGDAAHPYALQWWLELGKPVVGEVRPALDSDGLTRPPAPAVELDPVAVALWRIESARSGMPIAVRCLATWWRVQSVVDPSHEPGAVAAAVAGAVARAAGMRRRRDEASRSYGTSPDAVERVVGDLADRLRLDRLRGW